MKTNKLSLRPLTGSAHLFVLLVCFYLQPSVLLAEDWKFSGVNRIVAVSDIHGAYDAVVATFQKAGIIDNNLAWVGGDTHLVITGDLLDRGPGSRKVMDLIMRLEREAPRAGGQVHQLLGNHEVMNLIGDVRYVADSEYAAFAAEESTQEREYWYRQYRKDQAADADEKAVRAEFDQKTPPGFFGHRRAFRGDGYYGKWLLEKPLMIVINDTAFVHGGAPPYVAEHGLEGINGQLKMDLFNYVTTLSVLEDASVLSPVYRFREAPAILEDKMSAGQLDETQTKNAQAILKLRKSPLHGPTGPLWYRGTARCNPIMEGDVLDAALDRVGATRIVFGHTPTSTRKIQQRMNGRVVEIDTGMLKTRYEGSGNALILEQDTVSVANQNETSTLMPIPHPLGVGTDDEFIDDETLTNILTNGTIVAAGSSELTWKLVQVAAFDKTVFAYFTPLPKENGFIPEIAAYRLDRLLGLYMVPVTVRREIAGQQGTLQYVPLAALNESERVSKGKGDRAVCSMSKQSSAMFIFDALIHNSERTPLSMLYGPDDYQLMLVDHANSFGIQKGRPAYLSSTELTIGDQWRIALLEIDDETLRINLDEVLDKNRLSALGKRRDMLLENPN
ncbi:MAG: metallophosphoesterase [Xanthomonadales bacterium]|nr:metallophosphoesterase [Xanthomonadales bacterium]